MYFLGIDPGLSEVGFGVVELADGAREPKYVDCGIIKTHPDTPFPERLSIIKNDLSEILKQYPISAAGVEELFFVKNITNGIKVAHARGVIVESLQSEGIPITEFKPSEVKSNICGSGSADKKQVQEMIKLLLQLSDLPKPHDAADALALAILASRVS
ncbi:MAG: crossover junction endodeoxyribonuclease RuvC [Candidatus Peregrinibacteria bacterium]|nr:crossover junction endodeoxyribonuclease RuvC [Candidatus Peregrinibacteria bacterium]